jgi:D-proline reductase (dithiol) PrdB
MTSEQPPVRYIEAITQRYASLGYAPYRWYVAPDPPPFTPLRKPLSDSRLGVLTTSGCYVAGQVAYHYKDDTSIRRIPIDTPVERLRFAHITENYLESARCDPQCLVPLAALRLLREEGAVGALADAAISCMGGIYSQRRVREELIPQVEAIFKQQAVDVALLVPM